MLYHLLISAIALQAPVYAERSIEDSGKPLLKSVNDNLIANTYDQRTDDSADSEGILSSIYRFASNHFKDGDNQIESMIPANMEGSADKVSGATTSSPLQNRPNMRGLPAVQVQDEESSMELAISASQLQDLNHAKAVIESGVSDLHSILNGETGVLSTYVRDLAVSEKDVASMLQYMNEHDEIGEDIKELTTLMAEFQPMLEKALQQFSELPRSISENLLSSRKLTGTFTANKEQERSMFSDEEEEEEEFFSPPDEEEATFSGPGFDPYADYTKHSERYLRKLLSESRTGIDTSAVSSLLRREGGIETDISKYSFKHKPHRPVDTATPSVASMDTCSGGCNDITDDKSRKQCNCNDLITCVNQLKVNDFAVIFSRGLVDEETGEIEIETEVLGDGEIIFEPNSALNDIFDANELLEKIERIQAKAARKDPDCDAILEEFHVACKDWENGCSTSNGRSYRMTIDEICDSVNSPEIITFQSMSAAFDPETTIDETCDHLLPDEGMLLTEAKTMMTSKMDETFSNDFSGPRITIDNMKTGWRNTGNGFAQGQISFAFEVEWDDTMKETINDAFIRNCLDDESQCFPFKNSFYGTLRETERKYREKELPHATPGNWLDLPTSGEMDVSISFVCNDDGDAVLATVEGTTWSVTYNGIQYSKIVQEIAHSFSLDCRAAFQGYVTKGFDNAVDNIFDDYQACITSGCDIDNKVGIQACQEMVTCTEEIWDATEAAAATLSTATSPVVTSSLSAVVVPEPVIEEIDLEPAPAPAPETVSLDPFDFNKRRELFDFDEASASSTSLLQGSLEQAVNSGSETEAEEFDLAQVMDINTIPNPYPFAFSALNLALNKVATQSTTANSMSASLAVDGDPSTFSQTSCSTGEWWQVDLGAMYPIHNVRFSIESPTSCQCGGRELLDISNIIGTAGEEIDLQHIDLQNLDDFFRQLDSFSITFYDSQEQEILSANIGDIKTSSDASVSWVEFHPNIIDEAIRVQFVKIQIGSTSSACLELKEVEVNGYGVSTSESTNSVKDAKWNSKKTDGKWDAIAWPRNWNAFPNDYGVISLEDPSGSALVFRDQDANEVFEKVFSMAITGTTDHIYSNTIKFDKPLSCSIDVHGDDRCDNTRSLLFGSSASVGQICSIADAMKGDPDAMPGTCCLDNVHTLENFGERYECSKTCTNYAPLTLGFSEEACEQVRGTWCRKPCKRLKECIESKPSRDKCRVAASYEIGSEFHLTHSGNDCEAENDSIHLIISCKDENGMDCSRPTAMPTSMPSSMPSSAPSSTSSPAPSSVPSMTSTPSMMPAALQNSTSNSSMVEGFSSPSEEKLDSSGFFSESDTTYDFGADVVELEPLCEDRTLTFTYNITYAAGDENAAKTIMNFIKGKDGIQTDLFQVVKKNKEVRYGESLLFEITEQMTLCSNGKTHKVLIVFDMENSDFNEAFDDFTKDMIITDENDEGQCEQVRENLDYDATFPDDNEVCRTFFDIKCDYEQGVASVPEKQTGGIIPGFEGFSFEPLSFDGFEFESQEFVGFAFEGFDDGGDLSFQAVQEKELQTPAELKYTELEMRAMRNTIKATEKVYKKLKKSRKKIIAAKCKIPFIVAAGFGGDVPCKLYSGIKSFIVIMALYLAIAVSLVHLALDSYYSRFVAVKDEDAWKGLYKTEAIYKNINTLNTVLYSNLDIINTNMHTQHEEVRSTLGSQHEAMMELVSSQHTEIGSQLSEQHNSIGEQLTEQHTSLGEQLTDQHNSVGEQLTDQHTSMGEQLTLQHEIINEKIEVQTQQIEMLNETINEIEDKIDKIQESFNLILQGDFISSEFINSPTEFHASFLLRATNYGTDCFVNVTRVEVVFKNETGLVNILSDESPSNVQPGRVGVQHITAKFQVESTGLSAVDDAIMYYITAEKEEMTDIAPVHPR